MRVTNKVADEYHEDWFETFISEVLTKANIRCNEVYIEDIEPSRRFYLDINGCEYTIRTWNYFTVKKDDCGFPCAEDVEYTLVKHGDNGSEVIDEGYSRIEWENGPRCAERIMQIMTEEKQMLRRSLREIILDEGYSKVTFRRALNNLLRTTLSCKGEPRSSKQLILLGKEEE